MTDLIQRCKSGDKEALEDLYEQHKSLVYKTAFLFSKERTLAEDITQEVFIRVLTKIHLYDEKYPFEIWLYKVVVNVSRNVLRKQKWLSFINPFDHLFQKREESIPDKNLHQKEQDLILREAVDELPYKLKEAIVLKYFMFFSQEEIANILQIPLGTVKSRISSGLERLRTNMSREVFSN